MPPTFEFESELQEAIVKALEAVHCWPMVNRVVKHRRAPTGLGTGSPDLLVAIPTHGLLFIECKRDAASKPSSEQILFHARLRVFGQRVAVVRSVEEALAVVQAIRGGRSPAPMPIPAGQLVAGGAKGASPATPGPSTRPTRGRGRRGAATANSKTSQTKTGRAA